MTTIKLKNGSGAPDAADLVQGEVALDLTNKRIYSENASGTVIEMGTSPSTIDINAGTIDGTVIGGASAAAGTFTTANATTVDTTNIEVTNVKAKDGTASATIADSTGVMTIASSVLTTADINGGTIDGTVIGGSTPAAISGTTGSFSGILDVATPQEAGVGPVLRLRNTSNTSATGQGGQILFSHGNNVGRTFRITTKSSGTFGRDAAMIFENESNGGGLLERMRIASNGDISFYEDTGTTPKFFWDASTERLGIGNVAPTTTLDVTGTITADGLTVDGSVLFDKTTSGVNKVLINASSGNNSRLVFCEGASASEKYNIGFQSADSSFTIYHSAGSATRFMLANNGDISFYEDTGTTPKLFWDASAESLGIGTSSPLSALDVSNSFITVSKGAATTGRIGASDYIVGGTDNDFVVQSSGTGVTRFVQTSTEAMRIDSSGNLLVGSTTSSLTSGDGFVFTPDANVAGAKTGYATDTQTCWNMYSSGAAAYRFYVGWGGTVFATNTTISAISDQRLKENIQDLDAGLDKIMALKPRQFDWKEGKGKNVKGDRGFIAQEFEQVFPDLIDEWKDPAPEGEDPYKSVRADLIPVLVKAIQEQQAIIDSLKSRLDAAGL
jgi:hypothetical protein